MRLFESIVIQLATLPTHNTRRLRGSTWLLRTEEGAGVPALFVYFTLVGDRVVLQAVIADD